MEKTKREVWREYCRMVLETTLVSRYESHYPATTLSNISSTYADQMLVLEEERFGKLKD